MEYLCKTIFADIERVITMEGTFASFDVIDDTIMQDLKVLFPNDEILKREEFLLHNMFVFSRAHHFNEDLNYVYYSDSKCNFDSNLPDIVDFSTWLKPKCTYIVAPSCSGKSYLVRRSRILLDADVILKKFQVCALWTQLGNGANNVIQENAIRDALSEIVVNNTNQYDVVLGFGTNIIPSYYWCPDVRLHFLFAYYRNKKNRDLYPREWNDILKGRAYLSEVVRHFSVPEVDPFSLIHCC